MCGVAFASASVAQLSPPVPESCSTGAVSHAAWDEYLQVVTVVDFAEFSWSGPAERDGALLPRAGSSGWVLCLPTVPGLVDSYIAFDPWWYGWPVTTIFEEGVPYAGLDHEASPERMRVGELAPGVDYWVQYWFGSDLSTRDPLRNASTNWIHFRLEGPLQVPAPVNVHGAGVWGSRRLASNEIVVYWSASSGGGVVESFQIRVKEATGQTWSEWLDVPGGPRARWHLFGGLAPGRRYAFEVRAVNAVGTGLATLVVGRTEPDSRIFEAPCARRDEVGEPGPSHNVNVWALWQPEESRDTTFSGTALYLGWFVDNEPTSGSVEYHLCRPVFPGSKRYRTEAVTGRSAAFSPWGATLAEDGFTAAADALANEAQYWVQAAHQPAEGAGAVEFTTWIPADEVLNRGTFNRWRFSSSWHNLAHVLPTFERRIGLESYPGILETLGVRPLRQPAPPTAVVASESSPGVVALRWEPSALGGLVQSWQYRVARGTGGRWSSWRNMPGEVDRLTHVVDGLTPGERYTFEVRAENREESGEATADSVQLSPGAPSGCAEAASAEGEGTAVCLGGGRFRFEATWESQHDGRQGAAQMRRLTDSTGVATFFDTDNVELVFKVLDGTEANGNHWVFYGGMTDLGYTLTATDTQTGQVESYRNEPGSTCGAGDTTAFGAGSASSATAGGFGSIGLFSARTATPWAETAQAGLGCPGDALCLAGGRFEATVEYMNPATGLVATARPMLGTDNTGYMTFFSPDNVELAIKVLDGRAFNDSYWVFATGLTDVDYTITVKDTLGGEVKTYGSQDAGQFCTIQDLDAFPQ